MAADNRLQFWKTAARPSSSGCLNLQGALARLGLRSAFFDSLGIKNLRDKCTTSESMYAH